jgi:hypothetical protein
MEEDAHEGDELLSVQVVTYGTLASRDFEADLERTLGAHVDRKGREIIGEAIRGYYNTAKRLASSLGICFSGLPSSTIISIRPKPPVQKWRGDTVLL